MCTENWRIDTDWGKQNVHWRIDTDWGKTELLTKNYWRNNTDWGKAEVLTNKLSQYFFVHFQTRTD
jgi:hypothetical protein